MKERKNEVSEAPATKPQHTPGAMRAAKLIACSDKLRPLVLGLILREQAAEPWAEIIDREMSKSAPLLEERVRLADEKLAEFGQVWDGEKYVFDGKAERVLEEKP